MVINVNLKRYLIPYLAEHSAGEPALEDIH